MLNTAVAENYWFELLEFVEQREFFEDNLEVSAPLPARYVTNAYEEHPLEDGENMIFAVFENGKEDEYLVPVEDKWIGWKSTPKGRISKSTVYLDRVQKIIDRPLVFISLSGEHVPTKDIKKMKLSTEVSDDVRATLRFMVDQELEPTRKADSRYKVQFIEPR